MKKINTKKWVSVLAICCAMLCLARIAGADQEKRNDTHIAGTDREEQYNTYITVYAAAPEDKFSAGKEVIILDEGGYRLQSCKDLVNCSPVGYPCALGDQCNEIQLIRCNAATGEVLSQETIWHLTSGEHVSVGLVCTNDVCTDEAATSDADVISFVLKLIYHGQEQYALLGGHIKDTAAHHTVVLDEDGWKKIDPVTQGVNSDTCLPIDEIMAKGFN